TVASALPLHAALPILRPAQHPGVPAADTGTPVRGGQAAGVTAGGASATGKRPGRRKPARPARGRRGMTNRGAAGKTGAPNGRGRSEEHTSELQSRENL